MSYVCVINFKNSFQFAEILQQPRIMNKSEKFSNNLQELSRFAKAISHPARLAILKYLAEAKTCTTGDISENLPLSRTTVSQHLKELRDLGLIQGSTHGLKVNYCICNRELQLYLERLNSFFLQVSSLNTPCKPVEFVKE